MSEPLQAENRPLDLKAIFGWSMFDFANSSFTTVMVTAYFSIYFQQVLVPADADGSHDMGKFLWGLANSISQLLVIVTAPLVGALADFTGAKKKFLFVTYLGCSLMTLTLGWAQPGDVVLGMTLFIIANVFYSSGENIVGAFLPEIAPRHLMGRISGISWGLGYIGGIGALFLSMFILGRLGETPVGYGWVWVMIGMWFLIAGLPTFLFVKEKHTHEIMPPGFNLWTVGFHRLAVTVREARRFRMLFRFLIIFMLISVGITAVISFASIIANETLGFGSRELGIFLVVTNVVAVGGAWGWGVLQDRIGSIPAIRLSLVTWLIALLLVIFIHPGTEGGEVGRLGQILFWVAGAFVGIGMGASNSSCRALVGRFSPAERSGEFFGLWGLAMKLGSVVGPLLFGAVAKQFSDIRVAEAVLGVFFVTGFLLLGVINEAEGIQAATGGIESS